MGLISYMSLDSLNVPLGKKNPNAEYADFVLVLSIRNLWF